MPKSVVILGGSFAGLTIAHKLLKYTHKTYPDFKVTIVTPSTHLYWNLASVRHVLPAPHCFSDEELFSPIAPGFERYPRGSFELFPGVATSVDEDKNEVHVKPLGGGTRVFHFTALVVCTGSTYTDATFWKTGDREYHETIREIEELRARIEDAGNIVLGGAGPTGVETAAELGQVFGKAGKKKITLVSSGNRVVSEKGIKEDVSRSAEKVLEGYKVKLIKGARVESFQAPKSGAEGKTTVKLSNGETLTTDLYIPTAGVKACTSFLPAHLLAENGDLKVGPTLVAEGSANRSIYGAGDCTNLENKQVANAQSQAEHLAVNLDALLRGKELKPYVPKGKIMLFISLGRSAGVGQYGGWKVPSMVVSFVKSKALLVDRTGGVATGQKLPMGGGL